VTEFYGVVQTAPWAPQRRPVSIHNATDAYLMTEAKIYTTDTHRPWGLCTKLPPKGFQQSVLTLGGAPHTLSARS
jgi:hypothetical protein